jgi:hypothetical protein
MCCLSFISVSMTGADQHIMKLIKRADFIGLYYDVIYLYVFQFKSTVMNLEGYVCLKVLMCVLKSNRNSEPRIESFKNLNN